MESPHPELKQTRHVLLSGSKVVRQRDHEGGKVIVRGVIVGREGRPVNVGLVPV